MLSLGLEIQENGISFRVSESCFFKQIIRIAESKIIVEHAYSIYWMKVIVYTRILLKGT